MGDFNIDLHSCTNTKWLNMIQLFDLYQLIIESTRITPATATLIDHVYTTAQANISESFVSDLSISDHSPVWGFGAQLIGPIQLHVKRQNLSICKFFQDIASTFFLPVSGKICLSPIKKVIRQPTLIISFSQHSLFLERQSKKLGWNPTGVIRYLWSVLGSLWQNSPHKDAFYLHQPGKHRPMLNVMHI